MVNRDYVKDIINSSKTIQEKFVIRDFISGYYITISSYGGYQTTSYPEDAFQYDSEFSALRAIENQLPEGTYKIENIYVKTLK